MAIGDPTAPEDNERAIGGNLRNTGGRRPRPGNVGRRVAPSLKLPEEFAEFRLADGRFLGEVMGDAFFGPASGSDGGELLSKRVRELLREGNSPFPGIRRNSPENFAPPATAARIISRGGVDDGQTPGGDFEVEFTNLPYGPEEGDAPDIESDFPMAKRRPERIEAALAGQAAETPGEREITPADILDPRDRVGRRDPRGRGAQPDYEIQREISKLRQERDEAKDELAELEDQGDGVPGYKLSNARGKVVNLDQDIYRLEREAAQIRKAAAERRELAGRNAARWIPMTDGKADTGQLAEGQLYKTLDGTLFVWDGERFRQARRFDGPDGNGLTFAVMPEIREIPADGHRGVAETPDQIVANVERLAAESGALPDATLNGFAGVRALAAEVKRRKMLLDDARQPDPQSKTERTRILERGHRALMKDLRGAYADAIAKASPEIWNLKKMADRAGWPPRAGHAVSKFVQGGVNVGSNAVKGMATSNGSELYEKLRIMETLERDGDFRNVDDSRSEFLYRFEFERFLDASAEERARMKQKIVDSINAIKTGFLYSFGEGMQEFGEESLQFNQNFEEEFFASKLPEGLGKAIAYAGVVAGTALGARRGGKDGGSKGVRTAATTLLASQELAGEMFDDALEHGATLEQAFRARDLGLMLGLIEAIPIMPLLNKLTPEIRSSVLRRFSELIMSGTEAGIKEAAQKFGDGLLAEGVVRYDPERESYEGVVDSFKVSFTSDVLKNSLLKAIGLGAGN